MRRHSQEASELTVSVGSMGDIAFLLIIFFMICSNFAKQPPVKVKLPESAGLSQVERLPIAVVVDANGVIYLDGQRVGDEEILEAALTKMLQRVPESKQKKVLFKHFLPVMRAISRAGAGLAALGEKDN